ncbi:MAG: hypothetical protein K2H20_01780 [Bacilli bacterium]|nr:hypothetical protein [Bacilli bacterium]
MTTENKINEYKDNFNALASLMQNNMPIHANHIIGNYNAGLCPELQFIGWEALDRKDLPNNIEQNGIFIYFEIDFERMSVEVHSTGHIWLSRDEQKATNLAMTGLKRLCLARGCKWFRKQKYKDINDLFKRISTFYNDVMNVVNEYTGGYPYKQGIGWTDPKLNMKTVF